MAELVASVEEAKDEGRANRERWHWQETDLSDWVDEWLETNLKEHAFVETADLTQPCPRTSRRHQEEVRLARERLEKGLQRDKFELVADQATLEEELPAAPVQAFMRQAMGAAPPDGPESEEEEEPRQGQMSEAEQQVRARGTETGAQVEV